MVAKNLVLVHQNVQADELLMSSLETPENFLFNVSNETTSQEVLGAVQELRSLENLALIYHYPGYSSLPFLQDKKRTLLEGEENTIPTKPTYHYITDSLVELLKELKKNKGLKNMDVLTCDLNDVRFKKEMNTVTNDLGITINYSFNSIGNSVDWILESNGENIKGKYFNSGIDNWNKLLSVKVDFSIVNTEFISVVANDDNSGNTYTLLQDCSINDIMPGYDGDMYFELGPYDVFDGNGFEINYNNLSTSGIFAFTGTYSSDNDSSYPVIKNLGVINGIILDSGGGIVRMEQSFFKVYNCYNTGEINGLRAGGIVGRKAGDNGTCIITNCYNTGGIAGTHAGGIVGSQAGNNGNCTITNCYNNGQLIAPNTGGIAGDYTGSSGNCTITNCCNIGAITNFDIGGISGSRAGYNGTCTITNCYNTGVIGANHSGGIAGPMAGNNGNCTITNCYNTGQIRGFSIGGIAGKFTGIDGGTCIITNCYTSLKQDTNTTNRDNYVGSVATDASSVTVINSNDISGIENITDLTGKFTTDSYIVDNFGTESPTYPMLNGIFENFYKYDHYDASNLELMTNAIRNATDITALKAIFDLNTSGSTAISDFIQNLETNETSFKIYWGEDGDLVNSENVGIPYVMVRIPKDRNSIGTIEKITETSEFNSGVLVFEGTLTDLKEVGYTLLEVTGDNPTVTIAINFKNKK